MRRLICILTLVTGLGAAAPAQADFHPACDGGVNASTSLGHSAGTMTFAGVVGCTGADSIQITSLTLQRPDGSVIAATPASCGPCNSLTAVGTAPAAGAGGYIVRMSFRTVGNGTSFSPSRTSQWFFDGTNPPRSITSWTQLCDRVDGVSSAAASVDLREHEIVGLGYNGSVRCVGADAIEVTSLQLTDRTKGTSYTATDLGSCTAPCADPVIGSGIAPGPLGPGAYQVSMRFAVRRFGIAFANQPVQRTWSWLGAGPPVPCGTVPPTAAGNLPC